MEVLASSTMTLSRVHRSRMDMILGEMRGRHHQSVARSPSNLGATITSPLTRKRPLRCHHHNKMLVGVGLGKQGAAEEEEVRATNDPGSRAPSSPQVRRRAEAPNQAETKLGAGGVVKPSLNTATQMEWALTAI